MPLSSTWCALFDTVSWTHRVVVKLSWTNFTSLMRPITFGTHRFALVSLRSSTMSPVRSAGPSCAVTQSPIRFFARRPYPRAALFPLSTKRHVLEQKDKSGRPRIVIFFSISSLLPSVMRLGHTKHSPTETFPIPFYARLPCATAR